MSTKKSDHAALVVATVTLLSLAGCRTLSPVSAYGRNTYIVATESRGGLLESWGEVKAMTTNAANEHCAKLGRVMVPVKMDTRGARGWVPIEAELTFRCLLEEEIGTVLDSPLPAQSGPKLAPPKPSAERTADDEYNDRIRKEQERFER